MGIAAVFDLDAESMDAINAFLNSRLNKPVYAYLPDGYKVPDHVAQINLAMYGLARAPKEWYNTNTEALKEAGFTVIPEAPCIWTHPDRQVIIFFYVDDFVIMGRKNKVEWAKDYLKQKFPMRDMGPVEWMLGVKIGRHRRHRSVYFSQETYIQKIGDCYHEFRTSPNTGKSQSQA